MKWQPKILKHTDVTTAYIEQSDVANWNHLITKLVQSCCVILGVVLLAGVLILLASIITSTIAHGATSNVYADGATGKFTINATIPVACIKKPIQLIDCDPISLKCQKILVNVQKDCIIIDYESHRK